MSDIKDEILDEKLIEGHEYDGIKELDNPLPRWWLWLFFFSIIFAIFYYFHYEIGGGLSSDESLNQDLAEISERKSNVAKLAPQSNSLGVEEILKNPDQLAEGKKVFIQFCAACHGNQGQGIIGPNLTDAYWIHSKGEFESIITAIKGGFPVKGMPPWEALIPADQIPKIAAFVVSLKGTSPPDPKAPQGDKIE